ncbi:MAG TPA: PQQ-binding-like beta-propeller repeat protein, partial [Planctomycetota bacterium]|nr:PQQ-binding-like beta-propeller repeat protein [Planctomycetota bacterium]
LSLPGWSEAQDRDGRFTEAIDYQGALYAPAVSDGIVVTSLQLPFVLIPPDHYRQIQIIRVMPERRLFAFEAATGKPLWNTAPPANWDGESGSTAERVSVAGPPVIAGTRVVVPTVHLRGRVEFHVDCFDLHTGEHLWHTPLVTGQRELNMFSREIAEFTAPPVRVVGDRVFVATSIGSVACLDLVRGDTLWQSLYEQIEISKATYYAPGQMRSLWIHSPRRSPRTWWSSPQRTAFRCCASTARAVISCGKWTTASSTAARSARPPGRSSSTWSMPTKTK